MNFQLIAEILIRRRKMRNRETWQRDRLLEFQKRRLIELRNYAWRYSAFYRTFHKNLQNAPLQELPVLTKSILMENFDSIATDNRLKMKEIEDYCARLQRDELFASRYWVSATSGSSGLRSVIPSSRQEWAEIIASYARASEWGGVRIQPLRPMRMAVISSTSPIHQSARVGMSVATPLLKTLRMDASDSLERIIEELNGFQPRILVAYASMLHLLADAQHAGTLQIEPEVVNSSSETLTATTRESVRSAWTAPFEAYASTETGGIAAECDRHSGLHIFEDLTVIEPVDDQYRPTPDGETASRLLVSVLGSRSLPLIRYELTDRVRLSRQMCDCGRPFRLIEMIEGRSDDALEFKGPEGRPVKVHPMHFHKTLDSLPATGWQVRQTGNKLQILIVARESAVDYAAVQRALEAALQMAGARFVTIGIDEVAEIPAGASGKRPLFVPDPAARSQL